jgi:hypothetical protein
MIEEIVSLRAATTFAVGDYVAKSEWCTAQHSSVIRSRSIARAGVRRGSPLSAKEVDGLFSEACQFAGRTRVKSRSRNEVRSYGRAAKRAGSKDPNYEANESGGCSSSR